MDSETRRGGRGRRDRDSSPGLRCGCVGRPFGRFETGRCHIGSVELGAVECGALRATKVVIANCGSGAASQQWTVGGGQLRSGSLCAAISSTSAASPTIVLRQCASQTIQQWSVTGRFELQNRGDGKCLTDPGNSLTAGTQVTATSCGNAKNQSWWLP